jgi:NAD(P)H-binding
MFMILLLLRTTFLIFPLKDISSFLIPEPLQQQYAFHNMQRLSVPTSYPFILWRMPRRVDKESNRFSFKSFNNSRNNDMTAATKIDTGTSSGEVGLSNQVTRRTLMKQSMTVMLVAPFGNVRLVAATENIASLIANLRTGSTADHPITVIGAGGKTGLLCAAILTQQYGRFVRCVTRTGRPIPIPKLNESCDAYELLDEASTPSIHPLVTFVAGDVTKYSDMVGAVRGASGVIFAASASAQQRSDPAHVDYLGLYYTARACLAAQPPISRLVVISAGSISRPDALGYKATNAMVELRYGPQMMEYKLAGEDAVRNLYEESTSGKLNREVVASYVIVRPGGLRDGPATGAANMHVSQGDVFTSEVSRLDVAHITVAALLHPSDTVNFCTIEVNQKQGLTKVLPSLPDLPKALVHTTTPTSGTSTVQRVTSSPSPSSSYFSLLYGLLNDAELHNRYPDILNAINPGSSSILSLQRLMAE